jgi:hypothetical protein
MKKILLSGFIIVSSSVVFATTTNVTPDTYVAAFNSASNGDILLLDAGTYSTALDFPSGKTITLKKLPEAASTPILTFTWTNTVVTVAGSGIVLDGLEINPSADYYIQFAASSIVDQFIFKNCTIGNINRCLVRATNLGVTINDLTIENCIIKNCGSKGYCFVWCRSVINNMTVKNSTMYFYGGEGFFLAQNNAQTHTFVFNMQNNTIYNSGKDGAAYAWCVIGITYASTCTYNISNNIFNKPFTTADTRTAIIVPAGSGTVTYKNNLVVDYPNLTTAPSAGWDSINIFSTTYNYFKDTANRDFTLTENFPYKGTDNNFIGDPRWWPKGTLANTSSELQAKVFVNNGLINVESHDIIGSVEIYNIRGNVLLNRNINTKRTSIDAGYYNKGTYILKIKTKNKVLTKKIVLLK